MISLAGMAMERDIPDSRQIRIQNHTQVHDYVHNHLEYVCNVDIGVCVCARARKYIECRYVYMAIQNLLAMDAQVVILTRQSRMQSDWCLA